MNQYAAIHYVRIGRQTYTPGEIIDIVIPDGKRDHLLSRGAIRKASAPLFFSEQKKTEQDAEAEKSPDPLYESPVIKTQEASRTPDDDGGKPDDEDASVCTEEPGDDEEGDESQEDAPIIDVMDGIIPSEGTSGQPSTLLDRKPRTTGRRKEK